MKNVITAGLAGALALAATIPAGAQSYSQDQQRYQQAQREYQQKLRDYEAARAQYERERAAWERRYGGGGGYPPFYGPPPPPPVYDPGYGGGYDPRYGAPTKPGYYDPYQPYRNNPCEQRGNDRAAGTVIGALIGGALGAALAGDDSETEGAVLGAVVGGTLGNNIAGNPDTAGRYAAHCDSYGYYFTSDQTFAYRESNLDRRDRSGRYNYDYYARERCRLAIAPADYGGRANYRYVRVCPDRQNRYRITG